MNLYLVVSVVLLSTMWIMYLRAAIVEGDEDEMRAWLRWQLSNKNPNRFRSHVEPERHVDSTDWFNSRPNTFLDVPLPPVAEHNDDPTRRDDF
jgi:hypothetical protein